MRRILRPLAAALALLAAPVTAQEAQPPVTAAEMLAEARRMAQGDPATLAQVDAAQAEASKGVPGSKSAVAVRQTIPGGASWNIALARRTGEPLMIAVRRIGAAPVTLRVTDAAGRQLCADSTQGATLACRIAPGDGALSVRVSNPGGAPTEAMLVTN